MERFMIKKLIVISDIEKASREVNFDKGLNIIIGGNKTGKSSLIKSIFYTFGCEVKFESDWKKLISKYIIYFSYGMNEYCITRSTKIFTIFKLSGNSNGIIKVQETDVFHDYSRTFMDILGVSMDCLTTKGKMISATPPLLFRFQYIDQDIGWSKIGESFTNMKYIEQWKSNTNKYVVGFQGEDYYTARQELNIVKDKIENTKVKLNHFNELLKSIDDNSKLPDGLNNEHNYTANNSTRLLFEELNVKEKEKIEREGQIYSLKNLRYEKNLELTSIKSLVKELEDDHTFALEQNDTIKCPFCGYDHENTMIERIEIVKDIQSANQLLKQLRQELKRIEEELDSLHDKKSQEERRYKLIKNEIEKKQDATSIIKTFRDEGKKELLKNGIAEKNKLETKLSQEFGEKALVEDKLKSFDSKKRRTEINKKLKSFFEKILAEVNVPLSTIKFSDFVQTLNKLGSELPRIIYAYHVGLYLYNLDRGRSVFNFLVIDTPNQQGQVLKNLQNIDSVLRHLLLEEGQVILGTERLTGYEEEASTVTQLDYERRCLLAEQYEHHVNVYENLYRESLE
ncbi:hypothetical protein MNQ98_04420 [Paenibacillus sp. N3/727]|uniref:hypothetical protein n=1 Tax=Paenibacillus sp. N3/727 TaxID=2925845 RepID=UPI001F52DA66|nr:hypothetical protein [Paenibacillus sp. N3/727]UNK19289.1 hypothetical protein MNQ98_04420 [Paenibacillus sp. N3/727]